MSITDLGAAGDILVGQCIKTLGVQPRNFRGPGRIEDSECSHVLFLTQWVEPSIHRSPADNEGGGMC